MNPLIFWNQCREVRRTKGEIVFQSIDSNFNLWPVVVGIEEFLEDNKRGKKEKNFIRKNGMIGIQIYAGEKFFGYIGPATPTEADILEAMFNDLLAEIA